MSLQSEFLLAPRWPLAAVALLALGACAPAQPPARPPEGDSGLRVGSLHLCRDSVETVTETWDIAGRPALNIRLKPELRESLRQETEKRVGLPLAVRLDGRVVSEPVVNEPITGGEISLSGPPRTQIEAIRAAIRRPC